MSVEEIEVRLPDVSRIEVISQFTREYVVHDVTDVRLVRQDDMRTLKVFLRKADDS